MSSIKRLRQIWIGPGSKIRIIKKIMGSNGFIGAIKDLWGYYDNGSMTHDMGATMMILNNFSHWQINTVEGNRINSEDFDIIPEEWYEEQKKREIELLMVTPIILS